MIRWSLFITAIFFLMNSEAQGPRCFDLFAQNNLTTAKDSALFYAEALDHLNTKYNKFLFKESLLDTLNAAEVDANFNLRIQARYRAYKLRKILQNLHKHDQFVNATDEIKSHNYAIEKIAFKLEKLTFLTDETATTTMSLSEKVIYHQAQHSLLAQGLARFLFHDEKVLKPSQMRLILSAIMTPFKEVYLRWSYALAYMPKLHGAIIPYDVIEKVAVNGYEKNKGLLKPYIDSATGKYAFNTFSTAYNWLIAGSMAFAVGQLGSNMHDIYSKGQLTALELLNPSFENSKKIADKDYVAYRKQKNFEYMLIDFKNQFKREPVAEELTIIKELIEQN